MAVQPSKIAFPCDPWHAQHSTSQIRLVLTGHVHLIGLNEL